MFLDQTFLSYRANTRKHTHTDAQTDSDKYSIVAICKNATKIMLERVYEYKKC